VVLEAIIAPIAGIVNTFQKNRARKGEIVEARHMKALEGIQASEASEVAADIERTKGLAGTLKDEFITIVVTIPLVLCFIPGMDVYVLAGFKSLEATPDWFRYLITAIYCVGAGVPLAGSTVKTIKSIMK
jgi:hypothetical protein